MPTAALFGAGGFNRYSLRDNMRILLFFTLGLMAHMAHSQETYENSVDGKSYIADWKTYKPKGGVAEQKGRVINSGVRLLSTQADFERNTTAEELSKLISYIQEILTKKSEGFNEGGEILLQIALSKENNPDFKMSYQGNLKEEYLESFYEALAGIELRTKQSTVTLQVHFVIKNA